MRMRELAAGELLVEEGQLGSVCYVVAKGELAVVSGGVPVDSVKGGDVFGESAMIYDVRRLVRVRVSGSGLGSGLGLGFRSPRDDLRRASPRTLTPNPNQNPKP